MKLDHIKYLRKCSMYLLLWMTVAVSGAQAQDIVIISDQASKPYQQVIEGFEESIQQMRPELELIRFDPENDKKPQQAPAVVFALGSRAVRESVTELYAQELVATMILSTKALDNISHGTAVLLKTDLQKQLELHSRILPAAKRIGVLYDPRYNQAWVDEAKVAAVELGLEIVAVSINSAKELPSALKFLSRNADSILGIADKTVYSSKTAKAVLLFSYRNRIPFIGLSKAWVKSGALFALDWDYSALGKQCAYIAVKIIDGKNTGKIETQIPGKSLYLLNLKTAKHMKLEIDQKLIDGASQVYR